MITYPVVEKFISINGEGQKPANLLHSFECVAVIFPVITVIHPGQIQWTVLVNFYPQRN